VSAKWVDTIVFQERNRETTNGASKGMLLTIMAMAIAIEPSHYRDPYSMDNSNNNDEMQQNASSPTTHRIRAALNTTVCAPLSMDRGVAHLLVSSDYSIHPSIQYVPITYNTNKWWNSKQ
jgi:hypothetical protein